MDLGEDHSDVPEHDQVTITTANILKKGLKYEEIDSIYWLKKLTSLHERLAAQMNLLMDGTDRRLVEDPSLKENNRPQGQVGTLHVYKLKYYSFIMTLVSLSF